MIWPLAFILALWLWTAARWVWLEWPYRSTKFPARRILWRGIIWLPCFVILLVRSGKP